MSTNGYEIRLELLKMAKDMLEQDWHAERAMAQTKWEQEVDLAKIKAYAKDSELDSIPAAPIFKAFPTEEEVIKKATALNQFIAQRA
jgi:hypothetical protein